MLQPKRVKYRNKHRGRRKGIATVGSTINFGDFALKATEPAWVTSRQLEAARRVITRYARRAGKVWIRVVPDKSVTARAAETRMGSGKGAVDHWVAVVKPGITSAAVVYYHLTSTVRQNRCADSKRFQSQQRQTF